MPLGRPSFKIHPTGYYGNIDVGDSPLNERGDGQPPDMGGMGGGRGGSGPGAVYGEGGSDIMSQLGQKLGDMMFDELKTGKGTKYLLDELFPKGDRGLEPFNFEAEMGPDVAGGLRETRLGMGDTFPSIEGPLTEGQQAIYDAGILGPEGPTLGPLGSTSTSASPASTLGAAVPDATIAGLYDATGSLSSIGAAGAPATSAAAPALAELGASAGAGTAGALGATGATGAMGATSALGATGAGAAEVLGATGAGAAGTLGATGAGAAGAAGAAGVGAGAAGAAGAGAGLAAGAVGGAATGGLALAAMLASNAVMGEGKLGNESNRMSSGQLPAFMLKPGTNELAPRSQMAYQVADTFEDKGHMFGLFENSGIGEPFRALGKHSELANQVLPSPTRMGGLMLGPKYQRTVESLPQSKLFQYGPPEQAGGESGLGAITPISGGAFGKAPPIRDTSGLNVGSALGGAPGSATGDLGMFGGGSAMSMGPVGGAGMFGGAGGAAGGGGFLSELFSSL